MSYVQFLRVLRVTQLLEHPANTVMEDDDVLAELRAQLASLDARILELVAERQRQATEIGRIKSAAGRSTRDFTQEKEVAARTMDVATKLGLDPELANKLSQLLIRASLTVQEHDRVQLTGEGKGRRVLIIGGAGKMGQWFARFLSSQGFSVEIADPSPTNKNFAQISDWKRSALDHDFIIVAAPLRNSSEILQELAQKRPGGIVFDVGSLKTPLRAGLEALQQSGVAATSIHPMFGPDTELLSGRHVIFIDLGNPAATNAARELFASTMVQQVEMDLDSHDRVIAYILGLSHAVNIAFLAALAESGEQAEMLKQLSSTTFEAQLDVARRVAAENPHLYYEIQALNTHGSEALQIFSTTLRRLTGAVAAGNEADFVRLMESGRKYVYD